MDTASPLEAPSFSDRALAARIKILRAVLSARLTGSDEEAPQQRLKDGPTELWLSSNAVADVAGALILLVQAGQLEQVRLTAWHGACEVGADGNLSASARRAPVEGHSCLGGSS